MTSKEVLDGLTQQMSRLMGFPRGSKYYVDIVTDRDETAIEDAMRITARLLFYQDKEEVQLVYKVTVGGDENRIHIPEYKEYIEEKAYEWLLFQLGAMLVNCLTVKKYE